MLFEKFDGGETADIFTAKLAVLNCASNPAQLSHCRTVLYTVPREVSRDTATTMLTTDHSNTEAAAQ